ncbi:MAG: DUF1905 domain-containing protein [Thermomicrobiales bacterium]|nr:DUF1905 domain-containing protein [Thermomicrobiales bacterium]
MQFTAPLLLEKKTATGVQVPEAIVEALNKGKRPPVRVTINGYTYLSTVAPMGGAYWIPVSAEVRANAGVAAGDEITVDLELDESIRTVEVPDDLAAALAEDTAAAERFAALSYSNQRRIVLLVTGAKTEETRARRVAKAIDDLRAGK